MSIFGRNNVGSTLSAPVYEGYSCESNGDLIAIQEGYEDQLAIIESIHALDMEEISFKKQLKSLKESGASTDEIESSISKYETVIEGVVGNVWDNIKKFFTKMWGKIKAFFHSVVRYFDGLFKSGKDFVEKYAKELENLNLNGYKFKMYNYTVSEEKKADSLFTITQKFLSSKGAFPTRAASPTADIQELTDKLESDKDDIINGLRGELVGGGNLDKEQFAKELFGTFRGGASSETDKEEEQVNISNIISVLKGSDKALEKAEKAITDCDKVFSDYIKEIDKMQNVIGNVKTDATEAKWEKHKISKDNSHDYNSTNTAGHKGESISFVKACSSIFSEGKNIALEYFRAWKEAIVERNGVYKSVCTSAFRYKKKDN